MDNGANANLNPAVNKPIFLAMAMNDTNLVKKVIKAGAPVNMRGYEQSPLLLAISNRDFEMVKILVENGADVHKANMTPDQKKYSAMEYAKLIGDKDILMTVESDATSVSLCLLISVISASLSICM